MQPDVKTRGNAVTTTSQGTLRELAIAAAEQHDRDEQAAARQRAAERREAIIRLAAEHADYVLGDHAAGVAWEPVGRAEDEAATVGDRAIADIDGQRFLYVHSYQRDYLYHLLPCPSLLHPPADMLSPPIARRSRDDDGRSGLQALGQILRDAPKGYTCESCAAADTEREERVRARRDAEATLPPLPTVKDREHALRDAAFYHQLAKDRFGQGDEAGALAAAAVSQSASALARTIQQDVQTWGESS